MRRAAARRPAWGDAPNPLCFQKEGGPGPRPGRARGRSPRNWLDCARGARAGARLLLAALCLFAVSARAEEPARLAPGEILRGGFSQDRSLTGFPRPLHSEGRFLLAPGQGLVWRGETPFRLVSVIAPGGLTQSLDG
ncbi:MAG: hypothetical protein RLZZ501_283, partial [Pseudomonadota bacterium]